MSEAVTTRRLVVGGLTLHVRAVGEGQPAVLVHGFGVSGQYMLPLARALSGRFAAFVPDLPGHGRSAKPSAPLGIRGLADALGDCIAALGFERPTLVANSLGCQVVTSLAVRHPECAGALVLIGPTVDPARRSAPRQVFAGLRDSVREPWSLVARAAHDDAVLGPRALLATARSALADPIEERLPLIEQPSLVVRGGRDSFVASEWAERVAALLPLGRLVVVPGEPHAVHYTRPDVVAEAIEDFVLEERVQAAGEPVRNLPHGHVAARQEDELRTEQGSVPLLGERRRRQPVPLAPDEQSGGANRSELGPQVSV